MRSSASVFYIQCPLVSLRSPSSCLHLFRRLPITSILPSIFPSITCFRGHFLRQILLIQLAFLLLLVRRIFLSFLALCNTSSHTINPTNLLHPSPAPHFKTIKAFLIYFPKYSSLSTTQSYTPISSLLAKSSCSMLLLPRKFWI